MTGNELARGRETFMDGAWTAAPPEAAGRAGAGLFG